MTIAVALAAGDPADQAVAAEYCTPALPARTIDALVSGGTYSHLYWDPPVGKGAYSFVRRDLLTGHATLAIDRLGSGGSSHPPSADISISVDAYVLHQVIGWARRAGYRQVNVIGHSMGSAIAATDADEWPSDVNRLVLTGYLNSFAPFLADPGALENSFYPAVFDPLFAGSALDGGYLTTLPGARGQLFYYQSTEDPAVVSWDEASKDLVSVNEISAIGPVGLNPAYTDSITAPVLIIDGQQDLLFCAGNTQVNCSSWPEMKAAEQSFFPAAESLTTQSVPETGHDLALSTTAPVSFARIAAWLAIR